MLLDSENWESGESSGVIVLSETAARRAGDYAIHPVLLDGALHVFSAAARTVEARGVKLKLPVRFGRILFLRPPGASGRVRASVTQCSEEVTGGRIGIYDDGGEPCVLIDGFRAGFIGRAESDVGIGAVMALVLTVVLAWLCWAVFRSGWRLKS